MRRGTRPRRFQAEFRGSVPNLIGPRRAPRGGGGSGRRDRRPIQPGGTLPPSRPAGRSGLPGMPPGTVPSHSTQRRAATLPLWDARAARTSRLRGREVKGKGKRGGEGRARTAAGEDGGGGRSVLGRGCAGRTAGERERERERELEGACGQAAGRPGARHMRDVTGGPPLPPLPASIGSAARAAARRGRQGRRACAASTDRDGTRGARCGRRQAWGGAPLGEGGACLAQDHGQAKEEEGSRWVVVGGCEGGRRRTPPLPHHVQVRHFLRARLQLHRRPVREETVARRPARWPQLQIGQPAHRQGQRRHLREIRAPLRGRKILAGLQGEAARAPGEPEGIRPDCALQALQPRQRELGARG